jgi:hypothetical protein
MPHFQVSVMAKIVGGEAILKFSIMQDHHHPNKRQSFSSVSFCLSDLILNIFHNKRNIYIHLYTENSHTIKPKHSE